MFVYTGHEMRAYIWMCFVNSVPMFVADMWLCHSNAETCSFYIQYAQIYTEFAVWRSKVFFFGQTTINQAKYTGADNSVN